MDSPTSVFLVVSPGTEGLGKERLFPPVPPRRLLVTRPEASAHQAGAVRPDAPPERVVVVSEVEGGLNVGADTRVSGSPPASISYPTPDGYVLPSGGRKYGKKKRNPIKH